MTKKRKINDYKKEDSFIVTTPEGFTHIYICALVLLFPLWVGSEGYANLTFNKFIFYLVLTGLWSILTLFSLIMQRRKIEISVDICIVILFVMVAWLSSFLSPFKDHVFWGSGRYNGCVTITLYGLTYIGVSLFGTFRKEYAYLLACSMFICGIVSILQLLGKNPLYLFPNGLTYYDHGVKYSSEFLGNIGNVDLFSSLLCFSIPIILCCVINENSRWKPFIVLCVCFLLFIAIYIRVLAGYVGLLFIGPFVILYVLRFARRKSSLLVLIALIFSVFISIIFLTHPDHNSFAQNESVVQNNKEEISKILNGHIDEDMGSSRIRIWKELLRTYGEYPIIGSGPGTVMDRVNIEFSRYVEETGRTLHSKVDNAHNEYLEYLICEGLVGVMLYLALIILTCFFAVKNKEEYHIVLLIGLIEYWIQSFFSLGLCINLPVIYVFWALSNSYKKDNYRLLAERRQ